MHTLGFHVYTLGLPHPPGNPLFVIIGRVFAILPIATTVAIRINILAAVCSAVGKLEPESIAHYWGLLDCAGRTEASRAPNSVSCTSAFSSASAQRYRSSSATYR